MGWSRRFARARKSQMKTAWHLGSVALVALLAGCGGGGNSDAPPAQSGGQLQAVPKERASILAVSPVSVARWDAVQTLPIVPVSAANLPDGKVLLWSAEDRFGFSSGSQTYTALLDPVTGQANERLVTETQHDMFCPGTTNLADGRLLINGGISTQATSIYDSRTNSWTRGPAMVIPRGYNANTLLADGSVFTLGGSWSGGTGGKHGEVWKDGQGWRRLTGVPIDPFLSTDASRAFGGDSHFWLLPAGNGKVFHAGTGVDMHWIDTQGNGSVTFAARRGDDEFSVSGNAVMFDTGRILKVGGGPGYDAVNANANSYVIDINAGVSVRKLAPMAYRRAFHNSVVLPNGQVVIIGGQTYAVGFSDNNSVLVPELFDPVTETFTPLPAMSVPRNYHSVALLLPDARVLSAGGGLCGQGCAANHADYQILSPNYLFTRDGQPAVRPVIRSAPDEVVYGTRIQVQLDSDVSSFALVRMSSTTHTVNNDQRRLSLNFRPMGGQLYEVDVPSNPGWALPGYWMLFALNDDGVPSVAKVVRVHGTGAPVITPIADQTTLLGAAVSLQPAVTVDGGGTVTYRATGLPEGVSIDAATGRISGTTTAVGRSHVKLFASKGAASVSTEFLWSVGSIQAARYLKFEALSERNGNAWTSMAELNLLNESGQVMPRTGWKVSADSQELAGENGAVGNAIDGNEGTIWHTQWQAANPVHPHWIVVDMGSAQRVTGLRYTPRSGGGNGTVARYRVYLSQDGVNWGSPVSEGNLGDLGDWAATKELKFNALSTVNRAPTLVAPVAPPVREGDAAMLTVTGSDPDGDAITFSASGLPPGMSINANSGVISGVASRLGNYEVTVTAQDNRGASSQVVFSWSVLGAPPVITSVPVAPVVSGTSADFTASVTGQGPFQYKWSFGDGSGETAYSDQSSVSHRYAEAGVYEVTLTVLGGDGVSAAAKKFWQVVGGDPSAPQARGSGSLAWAPRDGRLWAVNPDNDSVSVFDGTTWSRQAEVAVGAQPRALAIAPSGQVWVVNRGSASITVLDGSSRALVRTIALPTASSPHGIVFDDDGQAYVTLEAVGQVLKLSATGATLATANVGGSPRHLALSADRSQLLVTRFITRVQPGEGTAVIQTVVSGARQGAEVHVLSPASMGVLRTIVLQHSDKPDTTVSARGVPNYLAAPAMSPDGRSAWVPSKQDNILRGSLRDGQNLNFENTVRAISSRIDLTTQAEDAAARVDHDNASVASAALYHPTGALVFVALETSRQVAVLDPVGRRELFRFDTGRAPQALVLSPDGLRLFVLNFMDRTVGVHSLEGLLRRGESTAEQVALLAAVGTEKLSATVLKGKQLFYDARDPRLARDAYMSCASCHNDGGHDGRTWDLTGQGEGLRNTISLRGRAGAQGRLHWSGNFDEVQDFEGQIRSLAQGTGLMTDAQFNTGTRAQPLGDRKSGVSTDLDALAAYVSSLNTFDASPLRAAGGQLTASASAGRTVFAAQCVSCHGGADFTDSAAGQLRNVGTIKPSSGKRLNATLSGLDTPTLRDVWATAPYLHDGSAATVDDAVRAHSGLTLTAADLANVSEFVRQIGGTEPAVTPLVPAGTGTGLRGQYYNKGWFGTTSLVLTRTENPNFDWGTARPASNVNADNFVVKWTGTVQAEEGGVYRFQTLSDDGVRVSVNGQQVINNWTAHGPTADTSAAITLEAGKRYTIVIDYYEQTGGAVLRLSWQKPGATAFTAIPTNRLYLP